jgi:hypothetical protein
MGRRRGIELRLRSNILHRQLLLCNVQAMPKTIHMRIRVDRSTTPSPPPLASRDRRDPELPGAEWPKVQGFNRVFDSQHYEKV